MLKRSIDIVCSLAGLIILLPVYLVVALGVFLTLGRPIMFKQKRPGLNGKSFWMYKFRSMTKEKDEKGNLLENEKRLTPFGMKLRSTSLDELPELINVLKGDMSLVGPRPLKMEYLSRYTEEQSRRHEVRPGITGLAQVSGRNEVEWEKRFKLDVWYVDNRSVWLDIKIIFKTVAVVFNREGISPDNDNLITEPFQGSEKDLKKESKKEIQV